MSGRFDRWIEERLAEAPADLRERMAAALQASDVAGSGDARDAREWAARLRQVGDELLEVATRGSSPGESALTLLAADGFATLACELLAEQEPSALTELAWQS